MHNSVYKRKRSHKRKTMRKTKRKTMRKTKRKIMRKSMRMRGGDFQPAPGGAYFAGSAARFPVGTHLPLSAGGIPAGGFDPAVPAEQHAGGGHKRSRGRNMRGGGLSSFMSSILPDEIVNIGRSVPATFGHMADKFNGTISSPSSLVYPTQQPHVYQGSPGASSMPPIDVMSAFNRANAAIPAI